MQSLFVEVEKELPLTMERETDCRETWPTCKQEYMKPIESE